MLGKTLGYHASRPKHSAATDCRWRGTFGNTKEVVTFEAKIEHTPSSQIVPSDMGQAHNQLARANTEFGNQGYTVRGTIVTHLTSLNDEAESSAGLIKVVSKDAIFKLWDAVRTLLSLYRDKWSLDDIHARLTAAASIKSKLPETGWLIQALDIDERFISVEHLLSRWNAK